MWNCGCCRNVDEVAATLTVDDSLKDEGAAGYADHDDKATDLEEKLPASVVLKVVEDTSPPKPASLPQEPVQAPAVDGKASGEQDQIWAGFIAANPETAEPHKLGKMARHPSSENISFHDYTEKHRVKFERVLDLEKPAGWAFKQETDGVKVYTKAVEDCKFLYFKGVTEIKCKNLAVLLQTVFKTEERPKWDEMCARGEVPQYIQPYYKYSYTALKPPSLLIGQRDLCAIGRFRFEGPDCICATMQSTEHPEYPEKSDYVRVQFIEGGYVFRGKGNGVYQVTWTGCVDPKGWLPTWLANMAVTKQAITLARVRKHMIQKGLATL